MGLLQDKHIGKALNEHGATIAFAKCYVYGAGTDILRPVFSDPNLTLIQSNPMIADENGVFDLCHLLEGDYRIIITDNKDNEVQREDNLSIGSSNAFGLARHFDSVLALLDDTLLSYSNARGSVTVTENTTVSVPTQAFYYRVAAEVATDHHLITAGGVKLYVIPGVSGYSAEAFGTYGDGISDDTEACQKCIDVAALTGGKALFPTGLYKVAGLTIAHQMQIAMDPGAKFIAALNDMSIISCSTGHFSTLSGISLDGGGRTGVTGFDFTNLRHTAQIARCYVLNCAVGFHFRQLCWNTTVASCYAKACDVGYLITDGSNAMTLLHCSSDSSGSTTPTAGIRIRDGGTYPTEGVNIIGGFHQSTARGIDDAGTNTKIVGVYFETCTEADILLGGKFPCIDTTHHSSTSGTVCIKGRNCQAASIERLALTGARTVGLFDFDTSNTFCKAWKVETAGENTSLGMVTGLALMSSAVRYNEAGEVGINGEPVAGHPFSISLSGGGDIRAADFGSSSAFGTWQASKAIRWNAPNSHRFYSGTAGAETEQMRVEAGAVTLFGQLQASNLPTYADDAAAGVGGLPLGRVYKTSDGVLRIKS